MRVRYRRGDSGRTARHVLRRSAGLALLAVAIAGVGYPLWWGHRSAVTSTELLSRAGVVPARGMARHPSGENDGGHDSSVGLAAPPCVRASPPPGAGGSGDSMPAGVLEVPSISVVAPVLQGTEDAALAVAVGHDPSSPWPGAAGTSILLAHDVSFFSHIDELSAGQLVIWQSGCSTSTFEVTTTAVMRPGENIAPQPGGEGLALVTCWPTDALWWTSERYVVEAKLVSTTLAASPQAWPAPPSGALTVPAVPSLAATGLSLDDNPVPLGTLTLTGTPSPSYSSGPAPLAAANAAISEYIAARKSVEAQNESWWQSIAEPGVVMPEGWQEPAALDVRINVDQEQVQNVTLTSGPVTVALDVSRATLRVASVGD